MHPRALQGKRVLIVGFGLTGASVARFLQRHGISFDIADECTAETAASRADSLGCTVHTQFEESLFRQYDLLVISPGVPRSTPAVAAVVQQGIDVIGDIELFAGVVDIPVIAVTGSNGKSTVVTWITHVLREAGIDAVACGNIGRPALDSLELPADVFILELSSYQLESTRSLKTLSASVLNVSDDHLDRYDDIDEYAAVKRRVFEGAAHCVSNRDDPRTWPVVLSAARDTARDTARAAARNTARDTTRNTSSVQFTLDVDSSSEARWHRAEKNGEVWLCDEQFALLPQAELLVPGDHNAANALAVLALIEPLAVPFTALHPGLVSFTGLPHRTEFLGEEDGIRWYNDSKGTNVDACIKAIEAMPGPVVLIAGGIDKGADFTPLREVASRRVRLLVLIGRDRERIGAALAGAVPSLYADSLSEAVATCRQQARSGDVVLLSPACSSFDMFRNFEDRGEQFAMAVREVVAA